MVAAEQIITTPQSSTAAPDGSTLSEKQFLQMSVLIADNFGIHLPLNKKELLPRRLRSRLKQLGLSSYSAYIEYLDNHWEQEKQYLANVVSTNLTSFFREKHHFDALENDILPYLIHRNRGSRKLRIWSAGCSSGEEPYSISMVLDKFSDELAGWDCKVLATDLDTDVLSIARSATYSEEQLEKVPVDLRAACLAKVADSNSVYEFKDFIKQKVIFNQLNFLESWPMKNPFDIIFCRNALIYFEPKVQRMILDGFARFQKPNDYLIIGHSESLDSISSSYQLKGKTIYQKVK